MELTFTERLIAVHCWCGIAVGIPENRYRWMQADSKHDVYCPNGHTFVFTESYKEKYEAEQRRRKAAQDILAAEERSHAATRGHLTRTKKRVSHGVCTHCNRSFQDLRRHMRSKHPAEVKDAGT